MAHESKALRSNVMNIVFNRVPHWNHLESNCSQTASDNVAHFQRHANFCRQQRSPLFWPPTDLFEISFLGGKFGKHLYKYVFIRSITARLVFVLGVRFSGRWGNDYGAGSPRANYWLVCLRRNIVCLLHDLNKNRCQVSTKYVCTLFEAKQ